LARCHRRVGVGTLSLTAALRRVNNLPGCTTHRAGRPCVPQRPSRPTAAMSPFRCTPVADRCPAGA